MDIPWRTAGRSCDGALRRYPFTYTKVAKKGRRRLLNTPMGCVLTNWYADGDKREGRPLSYARYEMYRTWLSFYEPTSWAMVFDFRDTFFQRDPFATARETTAGQAGLDIPPKFRQDFQGQHGISTPRPPWRRRDLPPRTIHVAAAASLRPAPKDYPRRGRRVAATRPHGLSTSRPPRRRDSSPPGSRAGSRSSTGPQKRRTCTSSRRTARSRPSVYAPSIMAGSDAGARRRRRDSRTTRSSAPGRRWAPRRR